MNGLLEGRTAVITGGASGIGRAIARTFADCGADVVVADVRETPKGGGQPTATRIVEATDSAAKFVECDVTNVAEVREAVTAADDYGGIDVMVNNAGILHVGDLFEVTEAEFDRVLDVNAKGTFFGSQVAASEMKDNSGGSIINVSSIAGLRGFGDLVPYCASKGAVRLMTYALADGLAEYDIRVNAIHPGAVETAVHETPFSDSAVERTKSSECASPNDVADVALYLASDLSRPVTGESLTVNDPPGNR